MYCQVKVLRQGALRDKSEDLFLNPISLLEQAIATSLNLLLDLYSKTRDKYLIHRIQILNSHFETAFNKPKECMQVSLANISLQPQ